MPFRPKETFTVPREDFVSLYMKNAHQQPTHISVGVQTDYRENETQTDPYSPEYVVQSETTRSELLKLATLTWGRGLPAGMAEVESMLRGPAKQAWDAMLPPRHLVSQWKRREMIEVQEWAFREGEIKKLQGAQYAVMMDLLRHRNETLKEATSNRLTQKYYNYQKENETKRQKINNDYTRSLRKLEVMWRNLMRKQEQPGIIGHYKTYNGWSQTDMSTNKNTYKNKFERHNLYTDKGLLNLMAGLPASVLNSQVKRPKTNGNTISAFKLLEEYKAVREERNEKMVEKPLRFLVKKKKPIPRPATPRVHEPPEGDEEREVAVIYLQKLLRGRSIQKKMLEGKENQLDLIQELRSVNALQKAEHELKKADKELVMAMNKERDKARHKTCQEEASQAGVVGTALHHLFDTLSKELIRLQEERRINAFAGLAERDRRMREAKESGRRQAEDCRRRAEDEIMRQTVQVHQETVDLYLEDIILKALEQTGNQQARVDIRRKLKEVNDIAYAMEESQNNLQSEEIVSELVHSFLIPEIEKISARKGVLKKKQKHLQAAQSIMMGAADLAGTLGPSLSTQVEDDKSID